MIFDKVNKNKSDFLEKHECLEVAMNLHKLISDKDANTEEFNLEAFEKVFVELEKPVKTIKKTNKKKTKNVILEEIKEPEEVEEPEDQEMNSNDGKISCNELLGFLLNVAHKKSYSVFLTKANIENFAGQYLFYRMQLLHDKNRDLYLIYTRWGQIGENGMN